MAELATPPRYESIHDPAIPSIEDPAYHIPTQTLFRVKARTRDNTDPSNMEKWQLWDGELPHKGGKGKSFPLCECVRPDVQTMVHQGEVRISGNGASDLYVVTADDEQVTLTRKTPHPRTGQHQKVILPIVNFDPAHLEVLRAAEKLARQFGGFVHDPDEVKEDKKKAKEEVVVVEHQFLEEVE